MSEQNQHEFNESDARKFYKQLGHKIGEWTELRAIEWNPTKEKEPMPVISTWVNTEDTFVAFCKEWNGKRHVYVGVNPRVQKGDSKSEQIKRISGVAFDIDAPKPDKNDASTELENKVAEEDTDKLLKFFEPVISKESGVYKDFSGNGYHLMFPLDIIVDENTDGRLKALFDKVKNESGLTSKIDNITDLARVIKVAGTWSIKGADTAERPHRISRILSEHTGVPDKTLGEIILNLMPRASVPKINLDNSVNPNDGLIRLLEQNDKKLADLLRGEWKKYEFKSRSEAELSIASKLARRGLSPEEMYDVLMNSKVGKFKEENEEWRRNLIAKAKDFKEMFLASSYIYDPTGSSKVFSKYLNEIAKFEMIQPLYTFTQPIFSDGNFYRDEKVVWNLYQIKLKDNYRSWLLCDPNGFVTKFNNELSVKIIDEEDTIKNKIEKLPSGIIKMVGKILKDNGVQLGTKEEYKDNNGVLRTKMKEYNLSKLIFDNKCIFEPQNKLKDVALLKGIDWNEIIDLIIRWEALEKDPRLCTVHKTVMLKGIYPRLNAHSSINLNENTGKTDFGNAVAGAVFDRTTRGSLLGFAKSHEEVYKGTLDGTELPMWFDQIEMGDFQLLGFIFNIMEYGEGSQSIGATKMDINSISPIVLNANPLDAANPLGGFAVILNHLTSNPAAGRRFGTFVYSTTYNIITTRSTPESLERRKDYVRFFRAVEDYAKPELLKIASNQKVWSYLSTQIDGYKEEIERMTELLDDVPVQSFLRAHGRSHQRVLAATLQCALVDHLPEIALGNYTIEEILETAKEYQPEIARINLESIAALTENFMDEQKILAEGWMNRLPVYMKEIIETIQSKRVNIEKDKETGEITRVMLSSIEYKPKGEGYKNMGEMIKRLLDRKRGAEKYSATCGRLFGFQYRIVSANDDIEVILIKKKEMY